MSKQKMKHFCKYQFCLKHDNWWHLEEDDEVASTKNDNFSAPTKKRKAKHAIFRRMKIVVDFSLFIYFLGELANLWCQIERAGKWTIHKARVPNKPRRSKWAGAYRLPQSTAHLERKENFVLIKTLRTVDLFKNWGWIFCN